MRQSHNLADRASAAGRTDQHRTYDFRDFEFRDDGPTGFTFEGVASVVDTPYQVRDQWGEFTETIRAGAFNKTLRDGKADVALFINHDTRALPLATRLDGSLKLSADPDLRVVASLNPARPSVQEVRHAVSDGQARQMSIGFNVPEKRDEWNDDYTDRQVHEVMLGEASIVWRGASPTTSGAMRSYADLMRELTDTHLTKDEYRRAVRTLQLRFADIFDNQIEDRLHSELVELLGLGPDVYVCVVDHTDNTVIYCVYGGDVDGDMFQLAYTADAQGNVTLSTDTPVEVNAVTTYVPEPPEPGERSANPFAERDRLDRERLEMLRTNEPALLLL